MTDPSGSMTFGYDARGRLVEKTSVINSLPYSVLRSYTPGGRISSTTSPTGRSIDYDRTTCACKVDAVSTAYNGTTLPLANNLSYRPYGIAKGMNTGAGGTVNNTFDQSGRLTVANPGSDKERTYTYDNIGNLTSVSAPTTPWYNRTYTYDALNRLDHAEGPYGTMDYTYDNVGNRLTKVAGGQTETYTYITGTNKLSEITGTDTLSYTHDANGNITGIGNKTLTYNQNNRLIKVEENGTTLGEYTYNGLGQRIIKEVDGVTTVFHYDFNGNIIGESGSDGVFTVEYLYRGKGRSAMVDVASGEMYYFGNDQLGTPQILTDATNTVVWEGYNKPFGDADVNPNSSVVNNFRFLGQYFDEETGFHYNYHRYYEPRTGRFLTPDPIGLYGGINLFLYAENNPVNLVDPEGLKTCVGKARVLKGNLRLIGQPGGFSTPNKPVNVAANSAAVIPAQWGGKPSLRPVLKAITGKIVNGQSFIGITDVIGGKSPIPDKNVREALQELNPGILILELPSIDKDPGIVDVELTVPDGFPCPTGTKEKKEEICEN